MKGVPLWGSETEEGCVSARQAVVQLTSDSASRRPRPAKDCGHVQRPLEALEGNLGREWIPVAAHASQPGDGLMTETPSPGLFGATSLESIPLLDAIS